MEHFLPVIFLEHEDGLFRVYIVMFNILHNVMYIYYNVV